jgi:hypothetical protein
MPVNGNSETALVVPLENFLQPHLIQGLRDGHGVDPVEGIVLDHHPS